MKKPIRVAGWIVVGLTSLFFVQSGIQKLVGTEQMVDLFHEFGFPGWFRVVVGTLEIMGAALLAIRRLTLYAAASLGVLMIGAVATEITAGHGIGGVLLPGQWLILLVLITGARFKFLQRSTSRREANYD